MTRKDMGVKEFEEMLGKLSNETIERIFSNSLRVADILPRLKFVGFYFFSNFRPHFSRLERVLQNLLLSFKVFVVHNVASLGISVFPLHTSLSAYNRNIQFTHPPQLNEADSCIPNYDTESRRFQERESIMPQKTRLFPTYNIKKAKHKTVRFHPTTKVRGLSRSHARKRGYSDGRFDVVLGKLILCTIDLKKRTIELLANGELMIGIIPQEDDIVNDLYRAVKYFNKESEEKIEEDFGDSRGIMELSELFEEDED